MTLPENIVIDPEIMQGKPVIRGTRITVDLTLRKLSEGASPADLLDAYPHLTEAGVRAALAYAADAVAHEEIILSDSEAAAAGQVRFLTSERMARPVPRKRQGRRTRDGAVTRHSCRMPMARPTDLR